MRKALLLAVLLVAGCDANLPGRPNPAEREKPPDQIVDFGELYSRNCAGCHGREGKRGPAPPLNDPLFLAIIPDGELEKVIRAGRSGTPMPGFEQARGGALTDKQISIVVRGLKEVWGAKVDTKGIPPYAAPAPVGDAERGRKVFARACADCHGEDGKGGKRAGAVNAPAFLGLISDQALRRIIITGRPDLDMPSIRDRAGGALEKRDISDLMALLARWRQSSSENARP